jgi:hypothetical protein
MKNDEGITISLGDIAPVLKQYAEFGGWDLARLGAIPLIPIGIYSGNDHRSYLAQVSGGEFVVWIVVAIVMLVTGNMFLNWC